MRRTIAKTVMAGTLVCGLAACGDNADNGATATVELSDPVSVTMRPVLGCAPDGVASGDPYDPAAMAVIVTPAADGTGSEACNVGPTAVTGTAFAGDAVAAQTDSGWVVNVTIRDGADGLDLFNVVAAQCFTTSAACPTGQMALVVDGRLVMKATVMSAEFATSLQISGAYDQTQAEALAEVMNLAA